MNSRTLSMFLLLLSSVFYAEARGPGKSEKYWDNIRAKRRSEERGEFYAKVASATPGVLKHAIWVIPVSAAVLYSLYGCFVVVILNRPGYAEKKK